MSSIKQPPAVGSRIKEIRKLHGLTLTDLSLKSGVSKSMLSQIEADMENPTIATVWKIASGLGIEFRSLMEGEEKPNDAIHCTRYKKATLLDLAEGTVHLVVLSSLQMVNDLELYLLNLDANAVLDSKPHHTGCVEYLTVLEGEVNVKSGSHSIELHAGDCCNYPADIPHVIKAGGGKPARTHLVVRFTKTRKQHL